MSDREIGDTIRWVATCVCAMLVIVAVVIALASGDGRRGNLVCNVDEKPSVVYEGRDWQHNVTSQEYKCIVTDPR